jgi:hypothetical protein
MARFAAELGANPGNGGASMTLTTSTDLGHFANELEAFAAWKEVLAWKLSCTTVHFEFVNVMREVREFNRECQALAKVYRSEA